MNILKTSAEASAHISLFIMTQQEGLRFQEVLWFFVPDCCHDFLDFGLKPIDETGSSQPPVEQFAAHAFRVPHSANG